MKGDLWAMILVGEAEDFAPSSSVPSVTATGHLKRRLASETSCWLRDHEVQRPAVRHGNVGIYDILSIAFHCGRIVQQVT